MWSCFSTSSLQSTCTNGFCSISQCRAVFTCCLESVCLMFFIQPSLFPLSRQKCRYCSWVRETWSSFPKGSPALHLLKDWWPLCSEDKSGSHGTVFPSIVYLVLEQNSDLLDVWPLRAGQVTSAYSLVCPVYFDVISAHLEVHVPSTKPLQLWTLTSGLRKWCVNGDWLPILSWCIYLRLKLAFIFIGTEMQGKITLLWDHRGGNTALTVFAAELSLK